MFSFELTQNEHIIYVSGVSIYISVQSYFLVTGLYENTCFTVQLLITGGSQTPHNVYFYVCLC